MSTMAPTTRSTPKVGDRMRFYPEAKHARPGRKERARPEKRSTTPTKVERGTTEAKSSRGTTRAASSPTQASRDASSRSRKHTAASRSDSSGSPVVLPNSRDASPSSLEPPRQYVQSPSPSVSSSSGGHRTPRPAATTKHHKHSDATKHKQHREGEEKKKRKARPKAKRKKPPARTNDSASPDSSENPTEAARPRDEFISIEEFYDGCVPRADNPKTKFMFLDYLTQRKMQQVAGGLLPGYDDPVLSKFGGVRNNYFDEMLRKWRCDPMLERRAPGGGLGR